MSLPHYDSTDPGLESLPRSELERLQQERLGPMLAYLQGVPFWRERLAGVTTLDEIPLTTRRELEQDQAAHPPAGSYAATPPETWRRFFTSSGTSGTRLRRVLSDRDWRLVLGRFARRPIVEPGDRLLVLGASDGLMGPTATVEAARACGALPILAGLWDTKTKVRAIAELRPQVVTGVASYLLHLAEVAAELGVDLAACGIRQISSVGEPGAAIPATQALLREGFGARHVHDGYGLTELFPLGRSCAHDPALHIAEDIVIVECVDPETGASIPDGELGELVYTNLVGDTQPLLRYRSGDVGRVRRDGLCACGSTFARVERIEGRADEMIWLRGVNVYPTAVEQVVRSHAGLASPEYRLVLDRSRTLPSLTVEVEADGGPGTLADELRAALGVSVEVAVLAPGTLPRGPGKARRVVLR